MNTPASKERQRNARPQAKPPADYPTHGLCLCGCGQKTAISLKSIPGANRYAGCPRLFIRGHNSRGQKRHLARRERYITRNGYVMVLRPNHPRAIKGYVAEHRAVVEDALGRLLSSEEHVHHINGNKQDNHPENLTVMAATDHSRHHFEDGTHWLLHAPETRRRAGVSTSRTMKDRGPYKRTPETLRKMSEATKRLWREGRFKVRPKSAETRQRIAEATRRHWTEGRHQPPTQETRRKMSEAAKNWRSHR